METTKDLLGIARLKIHPGKREELNLKNSGEKPLIHAN